MVSPLLCEWVRLLSPLWLLLLAPLALGEPVSPDTIYLPYSETEDVDFSIERPNRIGCYQWSCENDELIELVPVLTDYTLQCGSRLELKILPGTGDPQGPVTLEILAENVDMENYEAATQSVVYTVVVAPVAKLEVMGVKTEFQAGEIPSPFGVAAFDKDGNEFDSLDGVQLDWFIGSRKELARFKDTNVGPIVNLVPLSSGIGQVICMLSDPNYSSLDAGVLGFTVTAPLHLDPDGVYLLPGAEAKLELYEKLGSKEEPELARLELTGEGALFTVSSREPEIVRVDIARETVVAGEPDDETSLLVRDREGNILKGVPVRTASPARMEVVAHPYPESRQLILNHEYDINITIFDKEDHVIFPSENILTKTTFGKQFDIVSISMNGLYARVKATMVGVGKIKASLRSTLTPDDEETELLPHVKGVAEFEIYEEVLIYPRHTVLPWDSNTQPAYTLTYKVSGGGTVYSYRAAPGDMATVDTEGKVKITGGPGLVTVTAGMTQSMHNNHTATVLLLPPTHLELVEGMAEWMTNSPIQISVSVFGQVAENTKKVAFNDCSDVALTVTLSNNKDFSYEGQSERGASAGEGCVYLRLRGNTPGASTKVTVTLATEAGREVSQFRYISTYEQLETVDPVARSPSPQDSPMTVLPVGGSRTVLYRGGPHPWVGKPSSFYTDVEAEDESVVAVSIVKDTPLPYHAATVTCLRLGTSKVDLGVGNRVSSTNKKPGLQRRSVTVHCSQPARVSKLEVRLVGAGGGTKEPRASPATGRVNTYSYRDFRVVVTVKDSEGRTLDNVTSLSLQYTLSSPSLATQGAAPTRVPGIPSPEVPSVLMPAKASQVFHPSGLKGDLDIQVAVVGYRPEVLQSVGAATPPALPAPPTPFGGEDEDYDYDDLEEPGTAASQGLAEEVSLALVTDSELEALYD